MPYQGGQNPHKKKVRRKPASQGHPSQGKPTVGGGTKSKPKVYRSPTPSVRVQRRTETVRAPKRPGPQTGSGTRKVAPKRSVGKAISKPVSKRELRRARRKRSLAYLLRGSSGTHKFDPDTHIGPFNLEAELEGRGGAAKGASWLKKELSKKRVGGVSAAQALSFSMGTGGGEIGQNFVKDLVDLPAQAVPSAYGVGAGLKEAAEGKPKRIKEIVKEAKEHSPVLLVAQGEFKKAGKEAKKHPGLTALEVSGAGAAASRVAGAGVRAAGRAGSKSARRVGNTKRAPRVAPGTGMREPRTWSKGLVEKGVQVSTERRQVARANKLRQKAKSTRDPELKAQYRAEAQRRDPRVMSERQVARRTNEREDVAEVVRRGAVGKAAHEARKVLPKDPKTARLRKRPVNTPAGHRSAVSLLVAQRVVKPSRESVKAYRDQLNRELPKLEGAKARTTKRLRDQLNAALADRKLDFNKLEESAGGYSRLVVPRQKALVERGILAEGRERKGKLVPYAVQEMGAKWNPKTKELTLRDKALAAPDIEAHMRRNNIEPDEVPYVPQSPSQRGARNFYSSWHEPKGLGTKPRTGEATRKGTFEVNREVGAENVARAEGLIHSTDSYAGWVGENAYRGSGTSRPKDFPDKAKAERWRDDNLADSPYEWVAVPTRPTFGKSEQSKGLLDRAEAMEVGEGRSVQDAIRKALEGEGDGKFVLVPKIAATTKGDHARFLGSKGLKITRKVGRQFSATVLTTTGPTWPLGNIAEASVRSAVIRSGPVSLVLGRRTLTEVRKLDPKLADELEARIGDGHLGSYEMQRVHTVAKEFNGTTFQPAVRALGAFFRAPGPKQIGQVWNMYTRAIFGGNGFIEHQFRLAAFGRHLRNEGFGPSFSRGMGTAAEQAARGMRGTNEQVMAARFVDRALGQYGKFPPEVRFGIAVFTPFVAWAVNAVKFFGNVLPKDHPVLTGVLAGSARATEEWRKSFGLGKYVEGAAPGWMQPSIPVGGKLYPVGRFTPAGFWGDPLETGGSLFAPFVNGAVLASKGLDWKGDPLNDKDSADDVTEGEKLAAIANVAAGSFVPYFSLQQRIREKGATAVNPARGYAHNPKITAAYNELDRVTAAKKKIKDAAEAKGKTVDSDHPTPEYARLHTRFRALNERIFRESKGQYGTRYKEPYTHETGGRKVKTKSGGSVWDEGGSGSSSGSVWDD